MSSENDLELNIMDIRERNIKLLKEEFQKLFGPDQPEIDAGIDQLKSNQVPKGKKFIKIISNEACRKSKRLNKELNCNEDLAIEETKFRKKKLSKTPTIFLNLPLKEATINPNEVTKEIVQNISYKSVGKTYDSVSGTTCHQCRQKTKDVKSVCRNTGCIGKRGQFCGFCLWKRYGENVAEVLKDPEWHCPVCRNICNCSLCRAKLGKRPTGVLVPIAEKIGFKSVKDLLENYNEEINELELKADINLDNTIINNVASVAKNTDISEQ